MFVQTLKEAVSIFMIFARSIMERIGLSGGSGVFYSATALKKYLSKQPDNSPDKPINVKMKANRWMLKRISAVIKNTEKYVSLDLSGSPLTAIPEEAFYDCGNLASVSIPDGVSSIGDYAFRGCIRLASVTIPDSVTSIGKNAFHLCVNLASVTIPDGVSSIGEDAFIGCASLTTIYVSSGNNAYTSDNGILYSKDKKTLIAYPKGKIETFFIIPDGVNSIGKGAFSGCKSLASVSIPDSVTSIGECAFCVCKSLASVNLPDGVSSIEEGTFSFCKSFASVNLPDGVTSIGEDAFFACESLASVTIPSSVTSIALGAFWYCISLSSVTFQGTIPSSGFVLDIAGEEFSSFYGDLRAKFYATDPINGTPRTYTRALHSETWTLK